MGSCCSEFVDFDLMSAEVRFNIEGEKRRKTIYGLMMTCLYMVLVMSAAAFSLYNYFKNNVPIVSSSQHAREATNTSIDLVKHQLLPMFLVSKADNSYINRFAISRYFELQFSIWDGSSNTEVRVPVVPCSELNVTEREAFNYFWSESNVSYYGFHKSVYCPKPTGKLELKSVMNEGIHINDYMEFVVGPCRATSDKPNNCASKAEIQKLKYTILTPSSNLDITNQRKPKKHYFREAASRNIIPGLQQSNHFKLQSTKMLEYSDSLESLPKWRNKTNFWNALPTETVLEVRGEDLANSNVVCSSNGTGCEPYHVNTYTFADSEVVVTRKYNTFLDIAAMIGGIQGLTFSILLLLYTTYDKKQQIKYIANKVYPPSAFSDDIESKLKMSSDDDPKSRIRKSWIGRYFSCCCCKTKTTAQMLEERSEEKVMQGLDIISILKELSMLRVLIAALLTHQQSRLTPWVDLSLSAKERLLEENTTTPRTSVNKDMMSLGSMLTAARKLSTMSNATHADLLRRLSAPENERPQNQFEEGRADQTFSLNRPLQPIDLRKLGTSDQISVFVLSGIRSSVDQFISTNLNHLIQNLSNRPSISSGTSDPWAPADGDSEGARDSVISLGDGSFIAAPHQHEDDSKDQNTLLKNQL